MVNFVNRNTSTNSFPCMCSILVSQKTGITASMLRNEKPFSQVFPTFLRWIDLTTKEVSEGLVATHYPVILARSQSLLNSSFLFFTYHDNDM